jgi:IclR family transcriptional regulator, KDG regulon repressor
MLTTVLKAGQLLALFDKDHAEWRVSDVALALGIAKSSAHDLLSSLTYVGLLSQTDEGRYRLGWKVVTLSETLLATTEIRTVARPIMEQLMHVYQETLHLAILEKGQVVYLDKLEGKQTIRVELTGLGTHLYPHCSGLGKVLLAYLPWECVEGIIKAQGLPRFTEQTIVEADLLKTELDKIRQRGYAYDLGEIIPDLRCVAVPIRNYANKVIAAISMSVPSYRFDRARATYRNATIHAGKLISNHMGCTAKIN